MSENGQQPFLEAGKLEAVLLLPSPILDPCSQWVPSISSFLSAHTPIVLGTQRKDHRQVLISRVESLKRINFCLFSAQPSSSTKQYRALNQGTCLPFCWVSHISEGNQDNPTLSILIWTTPHGDFSQVILGVVESAIKINCHNTKPENLGLDVGASFNHGVLG